MMSHCGYHDGMSRPNTILVTMLALAAVAVTRADDDPPAIEHPPAELPPNQYPAITGVEPARMVDPSSYDDWPWESLGVTGNWSGVRNELIDDGIQLNGSYSALMFDNLQGGFDTGFFGAGITQIELTVDAEKAIGLDGGLFFMNVAQMAWYNGRFEPPGSFSPTGSRIGVDGNFPSNDQSWVAQLNQFYWRQSLDDQGLLITFGKIDANVTFAGVNAADGFQNGLAANPATLDEFLPTFPNPAIGLQIDLELAEDVNAHFGWWDGTTPAFDPATGEVGPSTGNHGVGSFFDDADHWFLISQIDVGWGSGTRTPGELTLGGWLQTGTSATEGDSTTGVDDVPGGYLTLSQTVWSRNEDNAARGGGVQLFGSVAWSPASKNAQTWSMMAGVSATGVIPGRNSDALGVMAGTTIFSDDTEIFRSTMRNGLPGPAGGSEVLAEVFYRIQVTPAMMIQPGLEWVIDPGGGAPAQLDDAVSAYLAVMIRF